MAAFDKAVHPFERYLDISGPDQYGKPKAHIVLNHSIRYSDGSSDELQEISVSQKPIVNIFRHAGYVNVLLDFKTRNDRDLYLVWELLQEYSRPINGVAWLPEEIETGYYTDENGEQQMVYFPMLELALIPVGKETEYQLLGVNPLFFTLQPNGPSGEPCVLQFTFLDSWFNVVEKSDNGVDLEAIRDEVMQELAFEQAIGQSIEELEME